MKRPISSPSNPSPPCWIGSAPSAKAIGRVTGAQIRSYGLTHSAAPMPTSR
ncbi:hypothetical protein NCG97_13640 [Streptomyces lydicamycinicus]|nr:hypothetical protein [Streptomyces lydicamycinicus]USA01483.1 hypothetical protein NCG97_13640 [Streptomyces lydicamycinicus]